MKRIKSIALFCLLFSITPAIAEPRSGHTNWGHWSFDWAVRDKAGLALLDVHYRGNLVIYKASLPVIRVRYEPEPDGNICGPYADRIVWGFWPGPRLVSIGGRCGGKKVCQNSFTSGGVDWLEMAVYARIGAYHLYQAWYLSSDGQIDARLFSKGLSCNADHDHHPYWRMDFDVNGASGDQILHHQGNQASGNFSVVYHQTEQNDVKDTNLNRRWLVRDQATANLVWVLPGSDDGALDPYGFSTKDVGLRLYHSAEDQPWPFGASGHLGYLAPPQNIDTQDIVFWYVAHMYHSAASGGDQWHSVGPTLRVVVPIPPPPRPRDPECVAACADARDVCMERFRDYGQPTSAQCNQRYNNCVARCPRP